MVNILAQMSWTQWTLAAAVVGVCFVLMIVILLQRGRGGGLSGAFGGGGGSAAFGAKTGDVFTWITVSFTAVFVLLTVVANFAFDESAQPTPTTEATTDGSEPGDAGPKVLELGGEPIKVTAGSDALPVTITPVTPAGDAAPTATGTPTLPVDSDAKPAAADVDNNNADENADDSQG